MPLSLKNMRSSIKKSKFFSEIKTRGSSPGRMLKCFNSSDLNVLFFFEKNPRCQTRGFLGVTWMGWPGFLNGSRSFHNCHVTNIGQVCQFYFLWERKHNTIQNTHLSFSISMNLEQQNPDKSFIQDFRCFFCNYCVLPRNQCVPFIAPKKKCSDNSWSFAACRISVSKATEMESTAKSTADWLLWVNS